MARAKDVPWPARQARHARRDEAPFMVLPARRGGALRRTRACTLAASGDPALRTRIARRYFGRIAGDQYVRQETEAGRGEATLRVITITPDRIDSHDFGPEAGRFGRAFFRVWRIFNPVPA